ncbi:MAG: amidohydrolase [Anaerolineae bacterium]|nr:amidohydrolase [Anaerolineae bacterium]
MAADIVAVNGTIYTMEPARPVVRAVAISGGRVVARGDDAEVRPLIGQRTEVLDLRGRAAIPGLTDAHVHLVSYGLSLQRVDLTGTGSLDEAVERVRRRAERTPPGQWIIGRGWDRNLWSPPRFPDRAALDAAVPSHPVALGAKDGHALWLNSAALKALDIDDVLGRWPGQVLREGDAGEPTGILLEDAAQEAWRRLDEAAPADLRGAIVEATRAAHRLGVTGVHNCEGGRELGAFLSLWRDGALELRIYMMIPRENLDSAVRLGLRTGFGDEWLRIGHLKLFADGSLGSHTADMLEPYEGEPANRGIALLEGEELPAIVREAARAGIAPAIHAIGDRANRRVLDALAECRAIVEEAGLRPRIEHVQLLARADIPRLAQVGAIASMQPIHATSDWPMAEAYWGRRCAGAYAWRSLLDAGTVLAFGSDCPVETIDPVAGIYAAVTRQRPDGSPPGGWYAAQCLTVQEAVRAYTQGAAYASGEERLKGSLAPGMLGDLVVLSEDIFRIAPEDIVRTQVVATVCGGRIVYSAEG